MDRETKSTMNYHDRPININSVKKLEISIVEIELRPHRITQLVLHSRGIDKATRRRKVKRHFSENANVTVIILKHN